MILLANGSFDAASIVAILLLPLAGLTILTMPVCLLKGKYGFVALWLGGILLGFGAYGAEAGGLWNPVPPLLFVAAEFFTFTTAVAAFRLARPGSWWARRFYKLDKMAKAVQRLETVSGRAGQKRLVAVGVGGPLILLVVIMTVQALPAVRGPFLETQTPGAEGPAAYLAVGFQFSDDGIVTSQLLSLDPSGRTLAHRTVSDFVGDIAVCPGGRRFAAVLDGTRISVWDVPTLEVVSEMETSAIQDVVCRDGEGHDVIVKVADVDYPLKEGALEEGFPEDEDPHADPVYSGYLQLMDGSPRLLEGPWAQGGSALSSKWAVVTSVEDGGLIAFELDTQQQRVIHQLPRGDLEEGKGDVHVVLEGSKLALAEVDWKTETTGLTIFDLDQGQPLSAERRLEFQVSAMLWDQEALLIVGEEIDGEEVDIISRRVNVLDPTTLSELWSWEPWPASASFVFDRTLFGITEGPANEAKAILLAPYATGELSQLRVFDTTTVDELVRLPEPVTMDPSLLAPTVQP